MVRNILLSILAKSFSAASFVLFGMVVTRNMNDESGFILSFFAFLMLVSRLSRLGTETVFLKGITTKDSTNRYHMRTLHLFSFFNSTILYGLLCLVFYSNIKSSYLDFFNFSTSVSIAIIYMLVICFFLIQNFSLGLQRSNKAYLYNLFYTGFPQFFTSLIILLVVFFNLVIETKYLVSVGVFLSTFIVFCVYRKYTESDGIEKRTQIFSSIHSLYLSGKDLVYVVVFNIMLSSFLPVYVSVVYGGEFVSAVFGTERLAAFIAFPSLAILGYFTPNYIEMIKNKGNTEATGFFLKFFILNITFSTVIFLLFLIFGKHILVLYGGVNYSSNYFLLSIFGVVYFTLAISAGSLPVLTLLGKTHLIRTCTKLALLLLTSVFSIFAVFEFNIQFFAIVLMLVLSLYRLTVLIFAFKYSFEQTKIEVSI